MPVGVNLLLPRFFILHSAFIILFWVIPRAGQRRDFPLGQHGEMQKEEG